MSSGAYELIRLLRLIRIYCNSSLFRIYFLTMVLHMWLFTDSASGRIFKHPVEFFLAPSFRAILGAAAAFTYVALVRKDGHPPAAHSIILRSVNPLLWKFWNFIRHPNPLISLGGTPELTELSGYYSEMSSLYNMWKDQWQSCITRHTERPAIWPFTEALRSSQPFYY